MSYPINIFPKVSLSEKFLEILQYINHEFKEFFIKKTVEKLFGLNKLSK